MGTEEERKESGILHTVRAVRRALAPIGGRRLLTTALILSGATTVALLAFTGFSFWWTSQPSFCGNCHPMKAFVKSWESSPHRGVNCERCHTTPGLFGFVGGKIAGLQVVANYLRGNYEDYSFNASVANISCLRCHKSILEKNIQARDVSNVTVSHKHIVEAGGKCMTCHSTVAHGSAVPPGSRTHPTMAACMKCHNDKIAPLRCTLCHTGRGTPTRMPPDAATGSPGG